MPFASGKDAEAFKKLATRIPVKQQKLTKQIQPKMSYEEAKLSRSISTADANKLKALAEGFGSGFTWGTIKTDKPTTTGAKVALNVGKGLGLGASFVGGVGSAVAKGVAKAGANKVVSSLVGNAAEAAASAAVSKATNQDLPSNLSKAIVKEAGIGAAFDAIVDIASKGKLGGLPGKITSKSGKSAKELIDEVAKDTKLKASIEKAAETKVTNAVAKQAADKAKIAEDLASIAKTGKIPVVNKIDKPLPDKAKAIQDAATRIAESKGVDLAENVSDTVEAKALKLAKDTLAKNEAKKEALEKGIKESVANLTGDTTKKVTKQITKTAEEIDLDNKVTEALKEAGIDLTDPAIDANSAIVKRLKQLETDRINQANKLSKAKATIEGVETPRVTKNIESTEDIDKAISDMGVDTSAKKLTADEESDVLLADMITKKKQAELSVSEKVKKDNATFSKAEYKAKKDVAIATAEEVEIVKKLAMAKAKELGLPFEEVVKNKDLVDNILSTVRVFMLGNISTQLKNVLGNAAIIPMVSVKDTISSIAEKVAKVPVAERTKAFGWQSSIKIKKEVNEIWDTIGKEVLEQNLKFVDNAEAYKKKGWKAIDWAEKGINWVSSLGDNPATAYHFKNTLGQMMSARKLDKPTNAMVEEAIQQAYKNTFKEETELAKALGNIKDANVLTRLSLGLLMPFHKTIANVVTTGIDYSPLGLVTSIVKLLDKKTPLTSKLDNLAKGITGTGVAGLGFALTESGLQINDFISGKDSELLGYGGQQPDSISIPRTKISIATNWSPEFKALAMGGMLSDVLSGKYKPNEGGSETVGDIVSRVIKIGLGDHPLSSIGDMANAIGEEDADKQIIAVLADTLASQLTPSLFKQLSQLDPYQRDTIADNKAMEIFNKVSNNLAVGKLYLKPKVDATGKPMTNTNQGVSLVFSPIKYSQNKDKTLEKLNKVYNETGSSKILPNKVYTELKYKGYTLNLTPEMRNEYNTIVGELYGVNAEKIMNKPTFKALTKEDKSAVLQKLASKVSTAARNKIIGKYKDQLVE